MIFPSQHTTTFENKFESMLDRRRVGVLLETIGGLGLEWNWDWEVECEIE